MEEQEKQGRRQFTAEQKADAVKRHVMGKEEVSVSTTGVTGGLISAERALLLLPR